MRLTLLALAAATLFLNSVRADEPNVLTPDEKAAGWKLLFDGKTTEGWVAIGKDTFPTQGWTVDDGTLHHAAAGGGGDVVSTESFTNFELTWDWKIPFGANSGLKYNLPNPAKNVGFEYQMLDDVNHPDGQKGGRKHQTASLYDLIEPAIDKKVSPLGEWNHSRILVQGNHVEHWLNGGKTVEFELGSDALKAAIAESKFKKVENFGTKLTSPLLLQDHGDETWFRSIKIRVIDAK